MQPKRASRRIRYDTSDKENICPSEMDECRALNKSPLPPGYPRIPLQDITDIISPENHLISDEAELSLKPMKPKWRKKCPSDVRLVVQSVRVNDEPEVLLEKEVKVAVTKSLNAVKETFESQTTSGFPDPPIPKRRKQTQRMFKAKPSSSSIMKFR